MNKIKTFMILILALIICISASLVIAIPEYIDPAILEEFETKKKVGMIVKVIDTSSIEISSKGSVEQQRVRDLERKEIFEDKVDAILAELSKSEFELGGTFILGNGFHGSVNRDGFNRLVDHPYVKDIYLEGYTYVSLVESRQLINADDAENLGYTGAGQTACVIDSGIDYDHPDLGGCFGAGCKVRMGWDYVNVDGDPDDDFGHGTHAAGIIASENNTYKGIAPDANLIALKVCNGSGACNNTLTIDALGYCYSLRDAYNISVVSISTGDLQEHLGNCPEWADDEINYLYAVGIPVIVSSGNQGYTNGISYTACSPNAISVGAVYDDALGRQPAVGNYPEAPCYDNDTQVDNVTCYTNRASNLDLLAPGQQMTTTDEGGGYITIGGTSAAAPIVSGAVLLLLQADPTLDVDEIKEILNDTGVPVTREGLTRPRIDIQAAINSLDTVQTFNISNSGSATLNVTSITNNSAWFSYIYPNSFTLNTSSYQLVKVIVNPSGYTPGAYSGIVSVNSDDPDESQVNISVTMNVYCIDNDRDGYDDYDATWCSLGTDCNDTNSSINPVATEICDDGIDNDCDNDVDYNDSDCTEADGESCTYDYQCDSGYCDNDGLGWVDDDHCFSIESTYYDNQDSKCEESARAANSDWCDEKRNEDLNT